MPPAPSSTLFRLTSIDQLFISYFAAISLLVAIKRLTLPGWPDYLLVHLLCVAFVVAVRWAARRFRAAMFIGEWYPLLLFIVCFEETATLSHIFVPGWKDHILVSLESRLFPVPPTLWLAQRANAVLTEVLEIGYFSYYLYFVIVGGTLHRRGDFARFRQLMFANALGYFICYAWYMLFPVEGPSHSISYMQHLRLPGGPFHWIVNFLQQTVGVHGNAFPSAHVFSATATLVFCWKYVPRIRHVMTVLLVLMCLGCVYDGYHYLSDVVAGVALGLVVAHGVLAAIRVPPIGDWVHGELPHLRR